MKKTILLCSLFISSIAFSQEGFPGTGDGFPGGGGTGNGSTDNKEVTITCQPNNKSFRYYLPPADLQQGEGQENVEILVRKSSTQEVVYEFSSPSATMAVISKQYFQNVTSSVPEDFFIRVIITERNGSVYGNFTHCTL